MRRTDLDPLVDIPEYADDHTYWVAVLSVARTISPGLHGLLHGFRCGGARLERRRNNEGRTTFRLRYESLLGVWQEEVLRSQWLDPQRDGIVRVFAGAAEIIEAEEAASRREVS